MTESEWLASDNPAAMLRWMETNWPESGRGPVMARKLRLWACACCRLVWDRLTDDVPCGRCGGPPGHCRIGVCDATYLMSSCGCGCSRCNTPMSEDQCPDCSGTGRVNRSRRAVEVAERYADKEAMEWEQRAAWVAAQEATVVVMEQGVVEYAARAVWFMSDYWPATTSPVLPIEQLQLAGQSPAAQAALLRGIVGNPWRPAELPFTQSGEDWVCPWLRWQNGTIPALARTIYDERKWELMPALGDALEDAGCGNEDVLRHCRGQKRCPRCVSSGKDGCIHRHGKHGPGYYPCTECRVPDCDDEIPGTGWLPAGPACGRCEGKGYVVINLEKKGGPERGPEIRYVVEPSRDCRMNCSDCDGTGRLPPLWCRGDWVIDLLSGRE